MFNSDLAVFRSLSRLALGMFLLLAACTRAEKNVPQDDGTQQPLVFVQSDETSPQVLAKGYEMIFHPDIVEVRAEETADIFAIRFNGAMKTTPELEENPSTGRKELWYKNISTDTDVRFYDKGNSLMGYDVMLKAGADPRQIQFCLEGMEESFIAENGELVMRRGEEEIRHTPPYTYQEINGELVEVASRFQLEGDCLGFEVEEYNPAYGLTIDPSIYRANAVSLILDKQASNTNPAPGQAFTYRIRYRCASLTEDCQDATIVDLLPAEFDVANFTGIGGSVETADLTGTTLTWTLGDGSGGDLPAGSAGVLVINGRFPTCGPTLASGSLHTNSVTFSATNASSNPTATADVTLNGAVAACPTGGGGGSQNTDFRKVKRRPYAVVDGPVQFWVISMPTKDETGPTDAIYTVTDVLPTNAIFTGLTDMTEWTSSGSDGVIGQIQIQCANSGNWFTLIDNGADQLDYREDLTGSSHYANQIPAAATECLVIDDPNFNRFFGADRAGYFNISAIRFTVDESQWTSATFQPDIIVTYVVVSENPFAGQTVSISGGGGTSDAMPSWQAPVPNDIQINCINATVGTFGGTTPQDMDKDDGGAITSQDCVTSPIYGPGTGELHPLKSLLGFGTSSLLGSSSPDANAVPPQTLKSNSVYYELKLEQESSSGSIEGLRVFELLDANLSYDPAVNWYTISLSETSEGVFNNGQNIFDQPDCGDPDFTVIPNYAGTGRTALIWDFGTCILHPTPTGKAASPAIINIYLEATVKAGIPAGTSIENAFMALYDNQGVEQQISGCQPNSNSIDDYWNIVLNPDYSDADRSFSDMLDNSDLDGNGQTSLDFLCPSEVITSTLPAITDMVSEKLVKGKLDAQFSKYPLSGNTDLTGEGVYELTLENRGNADITTFDLVDILPHIGDVGVIPANGSRLSTWQEELAGAITVERSSDGGVTYTAVPTGDLPLGIQYSASTNPERFSADPASNFDVLTADAAAAASFPAGSTVNPWGASAIGAHSFSFRFTPTSTGGVFPSGDIIRITVPVQLASGTCPPGQSGSPCSGIVNPNAVAWNSFAFGATYDNGGTPTRLLDTEPIKVGLKMVDPSATAALGDFVWNDLNANGVQDGGEPGFQGVTVSLFTSLNVQNGLIDINGDGNYDSNDDGIIGNLTIIDGRVDTDGDNDTDTDDDMAASNRFGGFAIVDGYIDIDGDGNGGEINGEDDGAFEGRVDQTATDANGAYHFYGLTPSTVYEVRLDNLINFSGGVLAGYSLSPQDVTSGGGNDTNDSDAANNANGNPEITATTGVGGSDIITYDFGFFQSNSLGNYVWYDLDEFGDQTSGEPPVQGAVVTLYSVGTNGVAEAGGGDDVLIGTQTTGANGLYLFEDLPNGTYYARFDISGITGNDPNTGTTVVPSNWTFTTANAASNDQTDSDANLAGFTQNVTLTGNQTNLSLDAGLKAPPANPGAIEGVVWEDRNANGRHNFPTEERIEGITVNLLDDLGLPVSSTTTNSQGEYSFTGLTPADYQVQIVLPPSFTQTTFDVGNNSNDDAANALVDDADDNDFDPTDLLSPLITVTAGNTEGDIDAGIIAPVSLGNRVWIDANDNGVLDGSESGLAGVTVRLINSDGSTVEETTTTDANGRYLFDELTAGDQYFVEIVIPTGYRSSSDAANTATPFAADSDDNGAGVQKEGTIRSALVTLTVPATGANIGELDDAIPINGAIDPTPDYKAFYAVDFGVLLAQNVAIGNLVFNDGNRDGIFNGSDAGINGVRVELYRSDQTPGLSTPLTFQNTSAGFYLFDNLEEGDYIVYIPGSNFNAFQPLENLTSSTPEGGDNTSDDNADENGQNTLVNGGIASTTIVLRANTEPQSEAGQGSYTGSLDDDNVNLTVDFGFGLACPTISGVNDISGSGNPAAICAGETFSVRVTHSADPAADIELYYSTTQLSTAAAVYALATAVTNGTATPAASATTTDFTNLSIPAATTGTVYLYARISTGGSSPYVNGSCEPFFEGQIQIDIPATVEAGAAQTICETETVTLNGSIGGGASSSTWSTSGDGTFNTASALNAIYTPGTNDIAAGTVTLTLTTDDPTGPCVAESDQMVVTIADDATADAGAAQTICETETVSLTGTIGGGATSLTWTTSGDGNFNNANSATAIYTPGINDISAGTVTLTLTTDDPAGSCNAASDQMVVTINDQPEVNANADQTICETETVSLNGSIGGGATSSTWSTSGDGTFNTASALNAIYTPGTNDIAAGTVTLTLTTDDPAGPCVAESDQMVVTIADDAIADAGAAQTICETETVSLTGTIGGGATSLTWTTSGDGTFNNANSATAIYTPGINDISAGTVTLTLTTDDPAGSCNAASDQMVVTINDQPEVNANADQTICETETVSLNGSISGGASSSIWTTSGDGTFNTASALNAIYTPGTNDIAAGTVTLTLTTDDPAGPCVAESDQMVVTINDQPEVNAGADETICEDETVTISGSISGSASSSTWTTSGDGTFNNASALNAIYTPGTNDIAAGTVTLTLTTDDPFGPCVAESDQMVVTINPLPTFTLSKVDEQTCLGNDGSFTLSGLTNGATYTLGYSFNSTPVTPGTETANGSGEITISNLAPGDYTNITVTDANTCESVAASVTIDPANCYRIGNLVWLDANNNGSAESAESGINGVEVTLYADDDATSGPSAGDTQVGTETTAGGGKYSFENLTAGTYYAIIGDGQASLTNRYSSTKGEEANPDSDGDNNDNGVTILAGATPLAGISSGLITLGPGSNEPTVEQLRSDDGTIDDTGAPGIPDNQSNYTLDFSFFAPMSVGNYVWLDLDGDGDQDGGAEPAFPGIEMQLLINDGAGNYLAAVDVTGTTVANQTTDATGNYTFTNLPPGEYKVVMVNPPAGYYLTTGGADVDADDSDDDSNAQGTYPGGVESLPFTLVNNTEPVAGIDGDDENGNQTVDFGLAGYNLGNYVWFDADNSGHVNGADGANPGLDGVVLTLLDANNGDAPFDFDPETAGVQSEVTTTNGGEYLFTGLPAGNYKVQVGTANFGVTGSLAGLYPSNGGANENDDPEQSAAGGTDQDDNAHFVADPTTTAVTTGVLILGPGGVEPTSENPDNDNTAIADNRSNLTLDLGFNGPLSLGDLVWLDQNVNGIQDGGTEEPGIDGVELSLEVYDPQAMTYGPAVHVNGNPVANETTAGGGLYSFNNLRAGIYRVTILSDNWNTSNVFGAGGLYEGALGTISQGGDDGTPNDDNGDNDFVAFPPNGIRSTNIELVDNGEGNREPSANINRDQTVDFAVTRPFSIGNRIWYDLDNNGILDAGEQGIDGVLVELYEVDGLTSARTFVDDMNTQDGGFYVFTTLPPGDYEVVLPASNFAPGTGVLNSYHSTGTNILANGTIVETPAVDPDNDLDSDVDENGTQVSATAAISSGVLTLGPKASQPFEPITDDDNLGGNLTDPAPDFLTNYTVDFGFYTTSLGNQVWEDQNNNGVRDAGEPAIQGVLVELLSADGTQVLDTDITNGNGRYMFENLPEGDYQIRLTPPAGFVSSTGTNGQASGPYEPAVDPNTVIVNNDDNGTQGAGAQAGYVISPIITQEAGNEHDVNLTDGTSTDRRVDFGLFEPLNIGNRVFLDDDGLGTQFSTANNGTQDLNEPGIAGVALTLYLDANGDGIADTPGSPIARDTTDADGYYMFDYLSEGTYVIGIDAHNFAAGQPLDALFSSTISDPTPNNDQDLDDNGIDDPDYETNGIFSGPITLLDDMEPTNDADKGPDGDGLADNNNSNLSVDFGFVAPATYGDYVWEDINQNGLQDSNEDGVAGVMVTLYEIDLGSMTIVRTVGTDVTDTDGLYLFEELAPNRYYYASYSNLPAGYVVTAQSASSNDSIDSDIDQLTLANVQTHLAPGEDDMTWDVGIYLPLSSVGDYAWEDLDEDGYQEAGEPPVPGVMVILYAAIGSPVDTTYTDANGRYLFEDLQPGDYFIEFHDLPAAYDDYVFSPANQNPNDASDSDVDPTTGRTAVFTLDPGEFDPNWDAGIYLPKASLGNRVWRDDNEDGIQDANEVGVPNVKVILYDDNGTPLDSTYTDAQGFYSFDELTPGDYVVKFTDLPTGFSLTDKGQGNDGTTDSDADSITGLTTTITLGPGENNPDIDAGIYRPLASLGDLVWEDLNENGIQDTNEPGVSGVTVVLKMANGTAVATTTTDANGSYDFAMLVPGDYYVTFSNLPTGYQLTGKDLGINDSLDSDADPITGQTAVTTLSPGENDPTWDAGIYQPKASLGDYVWEDDNENGIQDGGETGVAGVKVILFDANGVKLDSTATDANGFYLFDMLDPGAYYVQFKDIPTDYTFSPKDVATSDTQDSDADVNTGVTAPVTLSAGQAYRDLDAGIYLPKASLGDRVWNDLDKDGIQDPGEVGVAGIKVVLYDNHGNRIDSTNTNINGNYLFDELTPATYQLGFEMTPPGFTFSPKNTGGPANDSDADPISGITAPVTLAPGEDNRDVDAGIHQPLASLGNFVWNDYNEDGVQDGNEPGVGGVKVILLDGAGNKIDSSLTDPQGGYIFTDLTPGTYSVQFTDLPADFVFTTPDQGNDQTDSDAHPQTGNTSTVSLTPGQNYPDLDAGIYQPKAALGDKVWLDLDQDGEQDATESGVANVKVVLYDGTGTAVDSVLTDAQGNYLFPDLLPGDYFVQFKDLPADHNFSPQDNTNDSDDSDANQQGFTNPVTLGPGETKLTVDAGIIPPTASLGDYVWYDLNEDGVQNGNEPPVTGIQVVLNDGNGNPLDTTYTDASGHYLFEDLPAGDYIVSFPNIPTGYQVTDPGQGGDNTMDSDVDPISGQTGVITLQPGEERRDDADLGISPISVTDCSAEAYMSGGFAMLFTSGSYPGPDNRWVFDAAGGSFKTYVDGTARLSGRLVNASNSSLTFDMNLRLVNVKDWGEWTADGGQVKGAPNGPFMTWDFFEVDSLNSYLLGMGDTLWLSHMPVSRTYGFQLGEGANDKNSDYGLGGWWFFNSTSGNYAGTGDFNVTLDCQAGSVTPTPVANQLGAKALLQGPYDPNIGKMRTDLRQQGLLPVAQPFNTAPWNYMGTETLTQLAPDSIVDWVLVELRDVNNPKIVLARKAAVLLKGGQLVQEDGHSLMEVPQGVTNFYLVVYNWNHLAVMSSQPLQKYGNVYFHDFSKGMNSLFQDITISNLPGVLVPAGVSLLYQGDASGDAQINSLDLGQVMQQYFNTGSNHSDVNLDGMINSLDVGRAMQNYFKRSHVPK